ncbi:spore coat protein [Gracilibacillus xinjiangensis]|uniref:Spore coat protein n=1 Tax=Gracilibacillus xinjiangensis TaxID=1193282 RepID=A0ABV8WTT3_9BACI
MKYVNGRPVYYTGRNSKQTKRWNALDTSMCHPFDQSDDTQEANQEIKTVQESFESIIIKDSCDVEVTTTDTQAALNVQVGLQAAIALVISISIADSDKAERITQDLHEKIKSSQVNKQQTYVENSRGVKITTTDTDIAVNAQVLLQVLLALVARLDIL